jgi:NADH-quinone oxidoreductase subunit G
MAKGAFGVAISDYYLSNPIARASELMAELSANAKVRATAPLAAE